VPPLIVVWMMDKRWMVEAGRNHAPYSLPFVVCHVYCHSLGTVPAIVRRAKYPLSSVMLPLIVVRAMGGQQAT
jgi:hypothetical protein